MAVAPVEAFSALAPRRELRESSTFWECHPNLVVSLCWILDAPLLSCTYLGFEGPATEEDAPMLKATEKCIMSLNNMSDKYPINIQ